MDELPRSELTYWVAYYSSHPFPDQWQMHANLASLLHNCHSDKKHRAKPDDYYPHKRKSEKAQRVQFFADFKAIEAAQKQARKH